MNPPHPTGPRIGTFAWWAKKWQQARFWHSVLSPARASLIASLLVPVLFLFVDQGKDILRRVASDANAESHDRILNPQVFWLFGSLFVAGLASWGWARFLLDCDFAGDGNDAADPSVRPEQVDWWRRAMRRTCGVLPALGLTLGFVWLALARHAAGDPYGWYWVLAVASAGVGVVLMVCFEGWRRFESRSLGQSPNANGRAKSSRRAGYRSLADLWRSRASAATRLVALGISGSTVVSLIAFAVFTIWPVTLGELVGSPAVLLFAVAAWISLGSWLVYWGHHYRVPVLQAVLVAIAVFSLWIDNHGIRTLDPTPADTSSLSITNALDRWYTNVSQQYPASPAADGERPLYLVAQAGGGIRAAYWTAIVLAEIEDRARERGSSFAAHTFALSGVSGGALGGLEFVALAAGKSSPDRTLRGRVRPLLDDDFLAADLARMCFADLFQRMIPVSVRGFDRARSLEDSWSRPWDRETGENPFDKSLGTLYARAAEAGVLVPHSFLNGTSVETGRRIVTSNLRLATITNSLALTPPGELIDVISAADLLRDAPIRVSTAAHQSARFTYFSPAGRFPDGARIVDGGYFENSGAATLMDVLRVVRGHLAARGWKVRPEILLIDNDPDPAVVQPMEPGHFLSEALSPVEALLNTRTARGRLARREALVDATSDPTAHEFRLVQRSVSLPLGWTLSGRAIDEMEAQLDLAGNRDRIARIASGLPRHAR